jgi:hypothetical protein
MLIATKRAGMAIAIVGLFLLWVNPVSAEIERTFTRSFDVNPGGELLVETDFGSIEIRTSAQNTVDVEIVAIVDTNSEDRAEKLLEDFIISYDQDGDNVYVDAEYDHGRDRWNSHRRIKVHYNITVPKEYNLDLHTSGGSISVDDLQGEVLCKTSGGSLNFANIVGSIDGRTSGGSVNLESCEGPAEVRTSGGSIQIGRVMGNVDARTSGGSIRVDEILGAITAKTSGGSVHAYLSAQPEDDCSLETSGGNVEVYLAKDISVNVDARTSGGKINTEFPVMVDGEISSSSLHVTIGNAARNDLYLRTSGGNIYLRQM